MSANYDLFISDIYTVTWCCIQKEISCGQNSIQALTINIFLWFKRNFILLSISMRRHNIMALGMSGPHSQPGHNKLLVFQFFSLRTFFGSITRINYARVLRVIYILDV